MRSGSFAGDRIVLFTMVDLLLQVIFCGYLLFAANRASQGELQDNIAKLVGIFTVDPVSRYVDATSKMVAIADLDRAYAISASVKSTPLDDATKMLNGLDGYDLKALAGMDERERRALVKIYAALGPRDRNLVSTFVNRYGVQTMQALARGGLTPEQLRTFLGTVSRLPPEDRKKFVQLGVTFAKADSNNRQKIVDQAAVVVRPKCFGGKRALHITEVPGGYQVTPMIQAIVPDVARAVSSAASLNHTIVISESAFWNFGASVAAAHPTCSVNVRQDSTTNDERQLLKIQRWFWTDYGP